MLVYGGQGHHLRPGPLRASASGASEEVPALRLCGGVEDVQLTSFHVPVVVVVVVAAVSVSQGRGGEGAGLGGGPTGKRTLLECCPKELVEDKANYLDDIKLTEDLITDMENELFETAYEFFIHELDLEQIINGKAK